MHSTHNRCGAGWQPAADCKSAFCCVRKSIGSFGTPICNRRQDTILPYKQRTLTRAIITIRGRFPMTVQSFLRASFVLSLTIGVFGQPPKPPAPGGAGGSPNQSLPPKPGTTPTFPGNQDTTPNPNLIQRPVLLIGKVMMDDGTPPPDSVTVQLVCRSNPRSIAYTDSKGGFSADLGSRTNSAMLMDASESWAGGTANSLGSGSRSNPGGGFSERDLIGCTVQASLPGFRSDSVNLGRSEEHTSELQSHLNLVCRLLLE